MFIELMPLIEKRAITITVADLKDGHVRVNIQVTMPDHMIKSGKDFLMG